MSESITNTVPFKLLHLISENYDAKCVGNLECDNLCARDDGIFYFDEI